MMNVVSVLPVLCSRLRTRIDSFFFPFSYSQSETIAPRQESLDAFAGALGVAVSANLAGFSPRH